MESTRPIEPIMGIVISKALADKSFRTLLYKNHVEALKELSLESEPTLIRAFDGLNDSTLVRLAERVDWRLEDPINQAIS